MRIAQELQAEFRGRCPTELLGLVTEILDALEWHEAELRAARDWANRNYRILQRVQEALEGDE